MEITPSANELDSDDNHNSFIEQTYRMLLVALICMVLMGAASYRWLPRSLAIPLYSIDGAVWMLCGWFNWRQPVGVVFPLFCIVTGLCFGRLAHSAPFACGCASILTLATFSCLTGYVHFTRTNFSFLKGFLWMVFFTILLSGILVPFSHSRFASLGYATFGTLVFLCWILYDTSQVIENDDVSFTAGVAAFELLLDIIALHEWLSFDLIKQFTGGSDEE